MSFSRKMRVIVPVVGILLVLGALTAWYFVRPAGRRADPQPEVFYLWGWNGEESSPEVLGKLAGIFPGGRIRSVAWDSGGTFNDAETRAEARARALAAEIVRMPEARRRNLILVGHSLGGMIVIRTMAELRRSGVGIRRGIFLGAAIPDDDGDIYEAVRASGRANVNVYNRADIGLGQAYPALHKFSSPLGAFGAGRPVERRLLLQYAAVNAPSDDSGFRIHDAVNYVDALARIMPDIAEKDRTRPDGIDHSTSWDCEIRIGEPITIVDNLCPVQEVDSAYGWKLERVSGIAGVVYRIVDSRHRQQAMGSEKEMRAAFDKVKARLEKLRKLRFPGIGA